MSHIHIFGQEPVPTILTARDLLSDQAQIGSVWDMEVDSNGRIVMAGNGGVHVFDGITIKHSAESHTVSGPVMYTAIFKDVNHQLWVRGYNGEWREYRKDSLVPYTYEKTMTSWTSKTLESVWRDSLDQLHLAPRGIGYYRIDADGHETHVLDRSSGLHGYCVKLLADGTPFHFSISNLDSLKTGAGFNLYFIDDKDSLTLLSKKASKPVYESTLLHHDDGSFTLSMGNKEIFRFTEESLINRYELEFKVLKLFEDSEHNIWIGSDQGLYMAENGDLDNITQVLKDDAAAVVAEDRSGGLWIKSNTMTFGYIPNPEILTYERFEDPNVTQPTALTSDGERVYCMSQEGVTIIHEDRLTSISFPEWTGMKPLLPNETIPYIIDYDSLADLLWVVYTDRIASWNGKNWNPIVIRPDRATGAAVAGVKSLAPDTQIVVAGSDIFTIANGKLVSSSRFSLPFPTSMNVYDFVIDSTQSLWLATSSGLWKYAQGKLERPFGTHEKKQERSSRYVISAFNKIWVDFEGLGLFCVGPDSLEPVLDKRKRPIHAYAGELGPAGNLWIFGKENSRLFNIKKENDYFNITNFSTSFRAYKVFPDWRPICIMKEHLFVVTESNGVLRLHLQKLKQTKTQNQPIVDEVLVNHIPRTNRYHYDLTPDENSLIIEYGAVSFPGAQIQFRSRLLGLDSSWLVSDHNAVQYTNLDPGQYTFQIQVKVGRGAWSQSTEKVFVIASPYHRLWWFKLFVAFGLMAIGFGIYWVWSRVKETQNALEIRRIRAEQRALRAQLNPHFIFNSLSSVQYYLSKNLHREAEDYIQRFATVMRIILENSEHTHVPLSAELQLIRDYVELESARFDNSNIELTVFSPNLSIDEVLIPPLIFQPYIENSIVHGLRFKQGKKEIRIHIEKKDTLLQIIIEDNGVGRRASAEINGIRIAKRSLGMSIAEQRITALSKNLKKRITVKDLVDATGNACGTQITFFIPYESTNS